MKSIKLGAAVVAGSLVLGVVGAPAFAMGDWPQETPTTGTTTASKVPEIDATTGMAGLATVAAALAFAWERRRRDRT